MVGAAEAAAIEAIGKAEAEMMRKKASAYKEYGDAAVMSLVLEAMPKLASEIAAPLGKTEEIVMINEGKPGGVATDVAKLIGALPPSLAGDTDIRALLGKIPGLEEA